MMRSHVLKEVKTILSMVFNSTSKMPNTPVDHRFINYKTK